MKAFMLSASLVLAMLFGAVWAQEGQFDGELFMSYDQETDHRVSELMGAEVYVSEQEIVATEVEAVPEDWESVGSIEDFVVTLDGEVRGVLLDIGGFLGIGARTVMVNMNALQIVERAEQENVLLVFNATREELENAPEFDEEMRAEQAEAEQAEGEQAEAEQAEGEQAEAEQAEAEEPVAEQPEDERLGVSERAAAFEPVERSTLTADDLTGATVYDRFDERVSDIDDVVLSADGEEVMGVLINVGGFLGIGARTVAVEMDQLDVRYDPDQDEVIVYLAMTQEELENQPEYQQE